MTYDIDTSTAGGAVSAFLQLVSGALALQDTAFLTSDQLPDARRVGVWILLLGGVSQLLGQSVALFLNGVRPVRFVLSLVLAAVVFFVGVVVWIFSVWGAGVLLVESDLSLDRAGAVIALGHAPYLLSFLLLIPYYGPSLQRLLDVWTVACVAVGLTVVFDVTWVEALLVIGVGFLFRVAMRLLVGRWVTAANEWLFRTTAGLRTRRRMETVVEDMEERARDEARRWSGR